MIVSGLSGWLMKAKMLLFQVYETKRPAAVQTSCCLDKTAGEELLAAGGEPWVKLLLILSQCLITVHPAESQVWDTQKRFSFPHFIIFSLFTFHHPEFFRLDHPELQRGNPMARKYLPNAPTSIIQDAIHTRRGGPHWATSLSAHYYISGLWNHLVGPHWASSLSARHSR